MSYLRLISVIDECVKLRKLLFKIQRTGVFVRYKDLDVTQNDYDCVKVFMSL